MWPNNGFGSNGQFQNGFNQNEYSSPSYEFGPGTPGQYFPQQPVNTGAMVQYQDTNSNSFNEFQSNTGVYNEGAFFQNQQQFMSPNVEFALPAFTSQSTAPTPPRNTQMINARAAELKAQLLKGKEARGAAPNAQATMAAIASKQLNPTEVTSSLHSSPKTPLVFAENREQDLNALISQYSSETKPATVKEIKQDDVLISITPSMPQFQQALITSAKSQEFSLGSPTKITKPSTNSKLLPASLPKSIESPSDLSEGEIVDEPEPKRTVLPVESKKAQRASVSAKDEEQAVRKPQMKPLQKSNGVPKDDSIAYRIPPTKISGTRKFEDRRDDPEPRQERRQQPEYRQDRRSHPDLDYRSNSRRSSRDDAYRRVEAKFESKPEPKPDPKSESKHEQKPKEEQLLREQKFPTLEMLLPHDEDLREWLTITGYHNVPYRTKLLGRRRQIAALDAQRNLLLAEMEAEERNGPPIVGGVLLTDASMLPPTMSNKTDIRTDSHLPSTLSKDFQNDRVTSNKRSISEIQGAIIESGPGKIARTEGQTQRARDEADVDYRRPRSNGVDSGRRASIDLREDREFHSRFEDSRNTDTRARTRGYSRDRSISPGRRAYESRPPARTRSYEAQDTREVDGSDDTRAPEYYKPYKGRGHDTSHRGRGRGRGRGDFQSHLDSRGEPKVGARTATFHRGGRGGQ